MTANCFHNLQRSRVELLRDVLVVVNRLHAAFNLERRWCCAGINPHLQQAALRRQQHGAGVEAKHPVSDTELVVVQSSATRVADALGFVLNVPAVVLVNRVKNAALRFVMFYKSS